VGPVSREGASGFSVGSPNHSGCEVQSRVGLDQCSDDGITMDWRKACHRAVKAMPCGWPRQLCVLHAHRPDHGSGSPLKKSCLALRSPRLSPLRPGLQVLSLRRGTLTLICVATVWSGEELQAGTLQKGLSISVLGPAPGSKCKEFVEAGVQDLVGGSPSGTKMAHRLSIARPLYVALSRSQPRENEGQLRCTVPIMSITTW